VRTYEKKKGIKVQEEISTRRKIRWRTGSFF